MSLLESVTVTTGPRPTRAVIWLHGLGADGHDFEPIVPELRLPATAAVRFVFPHAPARPVTLNNGMRMRAWYDIRSLDRHGAPDVNGINTSATQVEALIAHELQSGLSASDIVLAGFSQGGAMALHTGLRYPAALAGIMGLSTYLPMLEGFAESVSAASRGVPILMAHGRADPVLPLQMGIETRDFIRRHGYTVEWHDYPMAHAVCPDEIALIGRWLTTVLRLDGKAA